MKRIGGKNNDDLYPDSITDFIFRQKILLSAVSSSDVVRSCVLQKTNADAVWSKTFRRIHEDGRSDAWTSSAKILTHVPQSDLPSPRLSTS